MNIIIKNYVNNILFKTLFFASCIFFSSSPNPHFITQSDLANNKELNDENLLIYCAIGSHVEKGERNDFGYAQSLPYFVEKMLKNKKTKKKIKIILIDPVWQENFETSDLKDYIYENNICDDFIYLVSEDLDEKYMKEYLSSVLKKGGSVFLGLFTGKYTLKLYDALAKIENNYYGKNHQLYFIDWINFPLPLKTTTSKKSDVGTFFLAGKTLDMSKLFAIMSEFGVLNTWSSIISSNAFEFFLEQKLINIKNRLSIDAKKGLLTKEEADMKFKEIAQEKRKELEEKRKELEENIDDQKKLKQLILSKVMVYPYIWEAEDFILKKEEVLEQAKKYVSSEESFDYNIGSLVPTTYFPTIDFDIHDNNGVITVKPTEELKKPFNLSEMLKKENLYELAEKNN